MLFSPKKPETQQTPKGSLSTAKRFLFHENRLKDGIEFKTFFSVEATEYIRRYLEQERSNAKNDEYLFVKEDGSKIPTHALSMNFRKAAEKMGYIVDDTSNPFRPKRFRHLFRTACGIATVDSGFVMAFMGHANNTSAIYLEKSDGLFLKEYLKIEPYITVYGGIDKSQITLMNENYDELKQKYEATEKELESNRAKIIELYEKTERVKELGEISTAKQERDNQKHEDEIAKLNKMLHPFIENIDEISEFLKERAWQKEQKARAERDVQEQEEKDRAKKELGI